MTALYTMMMFSLDEFVKKVKKIKSGDETAVCDKMILQKKNKKSCIGKTLIPLYWHTFCIHDNGLTFISE